MADASNQASRSGARNAAEAEVEDFKEDQGRFVTDDETTRMGMVLTAAREPDSPVIFANGGIAAPTGCRGEGVPGRSLDLFTQPGGDPDAVAAVNAASGVHDGGERAVCCRRKDGSVFRASVSSSPVRDDKGKIVQHVLSFIDLGRRKRATVPGGAGRTLRGGLAGTVVDAFERRVLALGTAQGLLGRGNWDGTGLLDVIGAVLGPFGFRDPAGRFLVRGDTVRLGPKASLTLAMVFHELATNAERYGALSGGVAGRVAIHWETGVTEAGEVMWLRWQESGGPAVSPPIHKGFGSRLIEGGLARELDGEACIEYKPDGLSCRIVMPVMRAGGAR